MPCLSRAARLRHIDQRVEGLFWDSGIVLLRSLHVLKFPRGALMRLQTRAPRDSLSRFEHGRLAL